MKVELNPPEFFKAGCLFNGLKQYTPVHSVIESNFPGRIFVDSKTDPRTALV